MKRSRDEQLSFSFTCSIGETRTIERVQTSWIVQRNQWTSNRREIPESVDSTIILISPILNEINQRTRSEEKTRLHWHWIVLHQDRESRDQDSMKDLLLLLDWSTMFPKERDSQRFQSAGFERGQTSTSSHSFSRLIAIHTDQPLMWKMEDTIHCSWESPCSDQRDKDSNNSKKSNWKWSIAFALGGICYNSTQLLNWCRNLHRDEIEGEKKYSIHQELTPAKEKNKLKGRGWTLLSSSLEDLLCWTIDLWLVVESGDTTVLEPKKQEWRKLRSSFIVWLMTTREMNLFLIVLSLLTETRPITNQNWLFSAGSSSLFLSSFLSLTIAGVRRQEELLNSTVTPIQHQQISITIEVHRHRIT